MIYFYILLGLAVLGVVIVVVFCWAVNEADKAASQQMEEELWPL